METLSYAVPKAPVVVIVPFGDLFVPVWNPRKLIFRADQADLEKHMAKGGHIPRIVLWKGNGQAPWAILEGQRRYLSGQAVGWKEIEAEIVDISLEEAKIRAITSNQGVEVFWLDRYESWDSLMKEHEDWTQDIWADNFGVSQQMISRCANLMRVLNAPARDMIRRYMEKLAACNDTTNQSHQSLVESLVELDKIKNEKAKVWELTEVVAFPLTGFLPYRTQLKDETLVARAQELALKTLPTIIERKLSGPQVSGLVAHTLVGGDPTRYEPSLKPTKARRNKKATLPTPNPEVEDQTGPPAQPTISEAQEIVPAPNGAPTVVAPPASVTQENPGDTPPTVVTVTVPPVTPTAPKNTVKRGDWGFKADMAKVFQGFTAAAVKDLLGKIPQDHWQAVGYICEKILLKGFKVLGHLLLVLLKHIFVQSVRAIHLSSKSVANWAVPMRSSSHSTHGSRGGQNHLLYIGHWVVYGFVMAVCYSILVEGLGQFFPWVRVWFDAGVVALLHLAGQAGLFLLGLIVRNALAFFLAGGLLIWAIKSAFNPEFGWIVAMGIVLLLAWHFRGWVMGELQIDLPPRRQDAKNVAVVVTPNPVPTAVVASPPPVKPKHFARLKTSSKKAFVVTQNSIAPTPATTPVIAPSTRAAVPANPMDDDKAFVLKFAEALYSIGYLNYQDRETTLLGWVTKDEAGDLKGHYFNPYVLKNMVSIHRTKAFTPDGPVKWVSSNETMEEFMVSGTIVGQGGWNGQGSNFTKTVKAHIQIIRDTAGKCLVKKINEEISE